MASTKDKLNTLLSAPFHTPVYLLASTEGELVQEELEKIGAKLEANASEEATGFDGPVPSLGDVIGAAGAISFYGTPRIVVLRNISPTTMNEKDVDELADLFTQLENAILVVGLLYKDKKAASNKKAKKLFTTAEKNGYAAELAKPSRRDNIQYIESIAGELGAEFEPGAGDALLDLVGENRVMLRTETEKLAAICGYSVISRKAVYAYSVPNIEADVFELARYITGRRKTMAFEKLTQLLAQRQEPIAIAAALAGTYIDMYRVRVGSEKRLATATIFEELGYKGSPYRLQKAKENAMKYSLCQLEDSVLCLAELDILLKSSALSEKSILLEATVGSLLLIGERR